MVREMRTVYQIQNFLKVTRTGKHIGSRMANIFDNNRDEENSSNVNRYEVVFPSAVVVYLACQGVPYPYCLGIYIVYAFEMLINLHITT